MRITPQGIALKPVAKHVLIRAWPFKKNWIEKTKLITVLWKGFSFHLSWGYSYILYKLLSGLVRKWKEHKRYAKSKVYIDLSYPKSYSENINPKNKKQFLAKNICRKPPFCGAKWPRSSSSITNTLNLRHRLSSASSGTSTRPWDLAAKPRCPAKDQWRHWPKGAKRAIASSKTVSTPSAPPGCLNFSLFRIFL